MNMNNLAKTTSNKKSSTSISAGAAFLIADPLRRNERAQEKRKKVLTFLRDEIWTSTNVVAQLLDIGYPAAHALMKALQRDGMTMSSPIFIPSGRGAVRAVLHGITAHGLAFAWGLDETTEPRRPWDAAKTNALFVPHQIETQLARVHAEKLGWQSWRPARLMMGFGLPKLPDAEGIDTDGILVAVEIEREIKTDRRYQAVIGAYIAQMKQDGRWQRVDYLCPNADFAARLARAFGRLRQLRLESKDGSEAKTGALQQAHLDRFRFYAADQWPNGRWIAARLSTWVSLVEPVPAKVPSK